MRKASKTRHPIGRASTTRALLGNFSRSLWVLLLGGWLLAACAGTLETARAQSFADDPEVLAFVERMVTQHGFTKGEMLQLFADIKLRNDVLKAIARPAERKPWHAYRPIFVTEARIRQGLEFWREHATPLQEAERMYGVPASIVVAIIGVETRYGRHAGRYRVIDSLATLAFHYPKRASFFRKELEELFLLAREEGFDLRQLKGSYAGAMGWPQFIASSYRRYAVDFDGDGVRDLRTNPTDAIGSVANYLKQHGWRRGEILFVRAEVEGKGYTEAVARGMKPTMSLDELALLGATPKKPMPGPMQASLLELQGKGGPERWIAFNNFYVVTRYNHSALYAMAVVQLAEAVRDRYQEANTQ